MYAQMVGVVEGCRLVGLRPSEVVRDRGGLMTASRTNTPRTIVTLAVTLLLFMTMVAVTPVGADHTEPPLSVTVAGSLQDELGCSGDWQPDCVASGLLYDAEDGVWQQTFTVPAGSWEYKAALNGGWEENYGAGAAANGPNIPLALDADTPMKFYYDHGTHWITDNRASLIATVPGDFQSELGCTGDWDPSCLRSWLQDPDGNGIYRFETTAIPAGSYQAKVAINESWDENYGAGGVPGGDNVLFTVPSESARVVFQFDSTSNVLTISPIVAPNAPGLAVPVVEHPVQDDVLYFAIPDRFADGDPSNNCGDYEGACTGDPVEEEVLEHGYLPTDKGYYHGGDLQGLWSQLPYLKAMGVTAVWVGPIYENQPVQEDVTNLFGHSSGYHGYWIRDFENVDPHLGTNVGFQDVVDRAHNIGIDVFMDVITNHTADIITYEEGQFSYRDKTNWPYTDVDGVEFDDSEFAYSGQPGYAFPEVGAGSFPYTPAFWSVEDETAKNPAWLNDPLLYHNRGNSSFVGENSLYGDFFGLDDLWTERKEVVEGMVDIYQRWIEDFGVDGFRIDTTKHVNMEFWQVFGPDIVAAAEAAGSGHFFAFGEVFDQQFGPQFLSEFSTRGELQSTIDFAFQVAARGFASQSGATTDLEAFFVEDDWYTDPDSNAYAMPTFVGNHDMGRIGYFLMQDNPGASDDELLARSVLAQALMYFSRGQPVIYYGDEQGFTGDGGDKDAREDMFPSRVDVYNDNVLIGSDATTADDNFDRTHPIYKALARYGTLYRQHEALRRGAQIQRYSVDGPGVFAFSRIDRDEQIEYVVAFNNAETPQTVTVPTYYEGKTQFHLLNTKPGPGPAPVVKSASNGDLTLTVPALDFVIYKPTAPIPSSGAAPGISIGNLVDGQVVEIGSRDMDGHEVVDRLEIRANLATDAFAEVTFAVRETGSDEYTVIGTDNNAPYRVFYDVTGHGNRTPLDFVAVVDDLNGHTEAAEVIGVVPSTEEPTAAAGYAVIHYLRDAGDYGDHTTGDFNDYWGLHLWGDIEETIEWTNPKPFLGEDEYGRFAWVDLAPNAENVGFIVHRGDVKDGTQDDRFFDPSATPEIWLRQDDPNTYTSQADAQGYVTIRYHRDDGDYGTPSPDYNTFWGLHLWGDAIDLSEVTGWTSPKPPSGIDDYGAFWNVEIVDSSQPVNFIIHRGDEKDPGPDESFIPVEVPTVWKQSGDIEIYRSRGAAEGFATIHYHRPAGDYGDNSSPDFNDFWGMHVWTGAADPNPSWQEPVRWEELDIFGPVFNVDLVDGASELAYILHRGDEKDPGPDQFLQLGVDGHEVWQLQGADPAMPYVLPVR
jgi:glycosidase